MSMPTIKRMHLTMKVYLLVATVVLAVAVILLMLSPLIFPPLVEIAVALDATAMLSTRSFAVTIALVLLIGFLPVLIVGSTLYAYIDGLLARKNGIGSSVHAR
ncbi:MAG: hypothetical protein Q7S01_00285 [bacterium]|nr:hypothetical protein [bacterium]